MHFEWQSIFSQNNILDCFSLKLLKLFAEKHVCVAMREREKKRLVNHEKCPFDFSHEDKAMQYRIMALICCKSTGDNCLWHISPFLNFKWREHDCAGDFFNPQKEINTSNQTTIHLTAKLRQCGKMWRTVVTIIFTKMTNRGYSRWNRFLSTHSQPAIPSSCQLPPAGVWLKRQRSLHLHSSLPLFNQIGLIHRLLNLAITH